MRVIRRWPTTLLAAFALAGSLFSSGCGSSSAAPATEATPATFSEVYPLLFPVNTKTQCDFCHGLPANDNSNGKLSMGMDKATAHAALVGVASTSSKCNGKVLVVPGDPDGSLFVQKLSATPPCGDPMPLGGDPITAEQLALVRSWITAGAKDD